MSGYAFYPSLLSKLFVFSLTSFCHVLLAGSEPRHYLKYFSRLPNPGSRFKFTMFPGSEVACYKSNTAKMMRGQPFHPETFVLPKDKDALLAAAAAATASGEVAYWVRCHMRPPVVHWFASSAHFHTFGG